MILLVTSLQLDCATGHSPLSSASQPGLNPPHYPLIQPTFPEIAYEDIFGAYVKGLAGMHVDIHCSSLIYPGSCATAEGDQVSSASFHFSESHADYLSLPHACEKHISFYSLHYNFPSYAFSNFPSNSQNSLELPWGLRSTIMVFFTED